jgi:hypothetical protein
MIVSGVKEGAILAKEANGKIVFKDTINVNDTDKPYIIITNFDHWDDDFRAYLDPTAGDIGHPRRLNAIKYLDAHKPLNEEILWETLNLHGVVAIRNDATLA